MNGYRFKISLRVWHPSIDPAKITDTLSKEPTRAWWAGTPRVESNGDPLLGTCRETYWTARLREGEWAPDAQSSECLAQAIEELLRDLAEHKPFFQELRASGGTVEFFVGWFFGGNTGEVFRHDLLRKLADLQIDLAFDIYLPDDTGSQPPQPSEQSETDAG